MIRQTIDKNCEHCHKPFRAHRITAKYCSSTCKTYASQERTGRKEPARIAGLESVAGPASQADREERKKQVEQALDRIAHKKEGLAASITDNEKQAYALSQEIHNPDLPPEQVEQLRRQKDSIEGKTEALKRQYDLLLFEEIKVQRERYDLLLSDSWSRGELKGKDIALFAKYRVRYPFQKTYGNINLAALGNPAQPFICYFCEGSNAVDDNLYYLVDVLAGVAAELLEYLNPKILFVIDRQMMNRHFEEAILKHNLTSDLITLKFAENRAEIEAALEKEYFEFVFFPDLSVFNLDYDFLISLLKKHPRTSIFCASEKPLRDFIARNRLNVQLESGWDWSGCGGILVTGHSGFVFRP